MKERFFKARQKCFDKLYSHLNERQKEAVKTVNGPLLIIAGAGSGKTSVLVHRTANIIKYGRLFTANEIPAWLSEGDIEDLEKLSELPAEQIGEQLTKYAMDPCPMWAVMCITFTNKAANEMKERLKRVIGEEADEIWAGTFHSICGRILRKNPIEAGLRPGFTIYDTDDTKKLINTILKDLNIDDKILPVKTVMYQISRAKERLVDPKEFILEAGNDIKLKNIAAAYTEYEKRKNESNALDFDDMILKTVGLLKNNEEICNYYQRRFKYVCVDEYQDTNRAQFVLTVLLSGKYRNLMVVGDDDQSIYKFRGATIENILNFDTEFKDAKVIKLEQNYRSTQNIINAANALIANNEGRRGKVLWTDNKEGSKITIKQLPNQNDEARFIVNKILAETSNGKRSFSDFAVLYRVNAQSNSLESVFAKSGIGYRILGGTRFYERKEIKDIIAYLCVILNTGDNLRLKRIINEPKRKIGDSTVEAVEKLAAIKGVSMFDILERSSDEPALLRVSAKLIEFTKMINNLREIAAKERLPVIIEKTIDMTGYRQMLVNAGQAEIARLENIEELLSNAVEYENNNEDATLEGFLEEVALISDIDNYDENADAVVLMTIHSAKGLEFPCVFLPGLEEGVFPSMQSIMEPGELEEERRLAYVAMTRAKEELYCTYVKERLLYGRTQYNKLSRFVEEIPEELINKEELQRSNTTNMPRVQKAGVSKEFNRKVNTAMTSQRTTSFERFKAGDSVTHGSFGRGVILSVHDMGADVLYEVMFDDFGTKKMMATYAKLKRA